MNRNLRPRHDRVHWVYPVVGGAMVIMHLIQVFGFEWPAFQQLQTQWRVRSSEEALKADFHPSRH